MKITGNQKLEQMKTDLRQGENKVAKKLVHIREKSEHGKRLRNYFRFRSTVREQQNTNRKKEKKTTYQNSHRQMKMRKKKTPLRQKKTRKRSKKEREREKKALQFIDLIADNDDAGTDLEFSTENERQILLGLALRMRGALQLLSSESRLVELHRIGRFGSLNAELRLQR